MDVADILADIQGSVQFLVMIQLMRVANGYPKMANVGAALRAGPLIILETMLGLKPLIITPPPPGRNHP